MSKDMKFTSEDLDNIKEFNEGFKDLNKEVNDLFSGLNSVSNEVSNQTQGYQLANKAVKSLTGTFGKIKDIQDDLVTANSKDLKVLQTKALQQKKNLEQSQRLLKEKSKEAGLNNKEFVALVNINGLLEKKNGLFQDIESSLEQIIINEKIVEDSTGILGTLAEGFSGGLKQAGLGALDTKLGIGEALEATKKMVREQGGSVSSFEVASHLAGQLGTNLLKSVGPTALLASAISAIYNALMLIDSSSGEIAKNFGVSAKEGKALVISSNEAAMASGDFLVTTKDVLAAQTALNAQFGTSVKFSGEFAAEFASVQERTGLSSEAMGRFAEQSMIVGGSIKDQLDSVQEVTMAMNAQEGLSLSQKDIQEGIANISNASLLTAGRSTKALAEQVFQTKLLGISQSQLENTANSLLDFQSSIESEMKAELLLGRELNLEKARAAALSGDQATLAAEIRREVGTSVEFGKLNLLQQNALANALGMSREEMATMLVEQEKLQSIRDAGFKSLSDAQEKYNKALKEGNLTEKLKNDLQEAGLLNQFKSATAAEKFTAVQDKMKDLFIKIGDPLADIINKVIDVLIPSFEFLQDVISPIIDSLLGISDIITTLFDPTKSLKDTFVEMGPMISGMAVAFGIIGTAIIGSMVPGLISAVASTALLLPGLIASAVAAVTSASALTLGVGAIAIVGGIAAVVAAMKAAQPTPVGDLISPSNGKTMVSTKEGGLFSLSPNDDLVAAPGAASAITNGGSNNNEVVTLLKELIGAVKQGGDVYIDGAKAGRSLALASSRMG